MNRRQFAAQLLTLLDRVKQDIAQVERVMAHTRQRLAEAEKERLKMIPIWIAVFFAYGIVIWVRNSFL